MSSRLWHSVILVAAVSAVVVPTAPVWCGAPNDIGENTVVATPALIREIQFMLLTLGIDPGPLDGYSKQLTNRAVHAFQEASGLPAEDIRNNGAVSTVFIDRLRKAAAQVMLRGSTPSDAESAGAPTGSVPAVASLPASVRPEPTATDKFANRPSDPDDFRIGDEAVYTPISA